MKSFISTLAFLGLTQARQVQNNQAGNIQVSGGDWKIREIVPSYQ
jgi:hypothetical protein